MSSLNSNTQEPERYQNVVVMRHGDRIDQVEPRWPFTASRPWDPPLVESGLVRAYCTGRKLRTQLGYPIHRAFVSPFLRCIQTASEAISALCAVDDGKNPTVLKSDGVDIDPSKLKVSIEFGLCEVLNTQTIKSAPSDGKWGFDISELEALLPAGTVDHTIERVFKEMPKWEESMMDARTRYVQIIQALADRYPSENLLLVTHGEGVGSAVSAFSDDAMAYEVEYCGYVELRRPITGKDDSCTAGKFELITKNGRTGVLHVPTSTLSLDV